MPRFTTSFGETVWDLPPLILHPFNEKVSPAALLENSKAALMLSGIVPNDGVDREDLRQKLLAGRHSEVRMLYYLGKDIFRWIDQCLECASRVPELKNAGLRSQSFASLLASSPPPPVKEKLIRWGVSDFLAIFSRAVGVHAIFKEPPVFEQLADDFLNHYHRYADGMFRCYLESESHCALDPRNFRFDLYASGEYTRLLESQWETS
jgi:hypothetical protein